MFDNMKIWLGIVTLTGPLALASNSKKGVEPWDLLKYVDSHGVERTYQEYKQDEGNQQSWTVTPRKKLGRTRPQSEYESDLEKQLHEDWNQLSEYGIDWMKIEESIWNEMEKTVANAVKQIAKVRFDRHRSATKAGNILQELNRPALATKTRQALNKQIKDEWRDQEKENAELLQIAGNAFLEAEAAAETARLEAAAEEAQEAERKAAEAATREAESKAAETARLEEEERKAAETARLEAAAQEAQEAERKAAEAERVRKAAEEAASVEAERKAAEETETARLETERNAAEEAQEAARKAAEETARLETDRNDAEAAARPEAERKATEEASSGNPANNAEDAATDAEQSVEVEHGEGDDEEKKAKNGVEEAAAGARNAASGGAAEGGVPQANMISGNDTDGLKYSDENVGRWVRVLADHGDLTEQVFEGEKGELTGTFHISSSGEPEWEIYLKERNDLEFHRYRFIPEGKLEIFVFPVPSIPFFEKGSAVIVTDFGYEGVLLSRTDEKSTDSGQAMWKVSLEKDDQGNTMTNSFMNVAEKDLELNVVSLAANNAEDADHPADAASAVEDVGLDDSILKNGDHVRIHGLVGARGHLNGTTGFIFTPPYNLWDADRKSTPTGHWNVEHEDSNGDCDRSIIPATNLELFPETSERDSESEYRGNGIPVLRSSTRAWKHTTASRWSKNAAKKAAACARKAPEEKVEDKVEKKVEDKVEKKAEDNVEEERRRGFLSNLDDNSPSDDLDDTRIPDSIKSRDTEGRSSAMGTPGLAGLGLALILPFLF